MGRKGRIMDIDPQTNTPEILERKKQDQRLMNGVLALLLVCFLGHYLWQFFTFGKFNTLLYVVQVGIMAVLFLIRDFPKRTSLKPYDWAVAIGGTWLPLLLQPHNLADIPVFVGLQAMGLVIAILGYLSLNKSLGIVPALRGVKTRGLYGFVRHPIYLAYFIAYGAFFAQNISLFNFAVLMGVYVLDILRILAEEKFLSQSPDYEAYMQHVRWRLIPYVW